MVVASQWNILSYGHILENLHCNLIYPFGHDCNHNKIAPYKIVRVDSYGATGDGESDDTEAFKDAWNDACAQEYAIFLVPKGGIYLVNAMEFRGPCGNLVMKIAGTIIAPQNPQSWIRTSSNTWLLFSYLNNFIVEGGGTLNGQGLRWWKQSCKWNPSNKCQRAPTAIQFYKINNLNIGNIESIDSPQIHMTFSRCTNVRASHLKLVAPGNSPNTDGIHIGLSQNIMVRNTIIQTGDDCVSIVDGSSDIRLQNITCGPGHGISIGSLGKNKSRDEVSSIVVDGATITGTTNGVRIKTWKDGSGTAMGIVFQNILMNNVSYPIIINQAYCDSPKSQCPTKETTNVKVSHVTYRNIFGTSATKQAIKLTCSGVKPCEGLQFQNINLVSINGRYNCISTCENAQGFIQGNVIPSLDCLQTSSDKMDFESK